MIRILLVDDEPFIKDVIKSFVNWQKYGYEIVDDVINGKEALEYMEKHNIDMVLTDIKMPGMNGLGLIHKVEESINPHVKSIIISAYSDFDYSREAINLKVNDYLLKPVKKEQLNIALKRVTDELKTMASLQAENRKNEQLGINKLLQDFLQGKIPDENWINDIFEQLGFNNNSCYVAVSVRFLCVCKNYLEQWWLLEKDLKHACERFLYPNSPGTVVMKSKREYIIFMDKDSQVLSKPNEEFKMFVDHFVLQGNTLSIGIGTIKTNFKNLISSSLEASRSTREFLLQGPNKIFSYSSIVPSKEYESFEGCYQMQDELLECIKSGNGNFRPVFHSLFNMDMYNSFYKFEMVFNIFVKSLQSLCDSLNMDINLILDAEMMKSSCQSMDELKAWLLSKIEKIIIELNQNNQHSTSDLNKAINYIHTHYVEPLTLEDMSSICYMSKTYFCNVFKKQTGKTFIEYVNSLRLHKASQLLTNTNMRIYKISEAVGYNHVNYFTKQFSRIFGVNPGQYRKMR